MSQRGYECGCVANTGVYAPDQETPAIEFCPLHQAAPALVEALQSIKQLVGAYKPGEMFDVAEVYNKATKALDHAEQP